MANFNYVHQLASNTKLVKSVEHGYIGKELIIEYYVDPGLLKVSKLYQRILSVFSIKKYKKLDLKLLVPAVVARRPKSLGPNGGDWLIDGQHKAVLYFLSGAGKEDVKFPACVYVHDESATLEECEKIEAEIFYALNTQRKKLNKVDEIRAGVVFDEPVSLWVERVLRELNLNIDGFGSNEEDAVELKSFNQFLIAATSDYKMDHPDTMERLWSGYILWKEMFGSHKDKYMTGVMYRACCLMAHFMDDVLENGSEKLLWKYLTSVLNQVENQTTLSKGFIDANAHRYIFFNILDKYRQSAMYRDAGPRNQIGDAVMSNAIKISKKFKRPENA